MAPPPSHTLSCAYGKDFVYALKFLILCNKTRLLALFSYYFILCFYAILKAGVWGRRVGSKAMSTCGSSRGSKFSSQHPPGGLWSSVTPVLRNPTLSSNLPEQQGIWYMSIHIGKILIHMKQKVDESLKGRGSSEADLKASSPITEFTWSTVTIAHLRLIRGCRHTAESVAETTRLTKRRLFTHLLTFIENANQVQSISSSWSTK